MAISSRLERRPLPIRRHGLYLYDSWRHRFSVRLFSSQTLFRTIIISLAFVAVFPPIYFHFSLRRFHQIQLRKCGWLNNPPLVCAHGGDSTKAFPNTIGAYQFALRSKVDCIEIDVSRSSDGVLFALHDRDLQQLSGNSTSKVGYLSMEEIKELGMVRQSVQKVHNASISTVEDALKLISSAVQLVVLDAKVGPPYYEKGLAKDILSVVEKTNCENCLIWAKSDNLVRDVIKQSSNVMVGYIVMNDPSISARAGLFRMKGADVVGVYHPLIDEKLVKILHGRKKKVYAWTIDDIDTMQKILFEHVDAIVTSNPTLLQSLMHDIRIKCLEEGFRFSQ